MSTLYEIDKAIRTDSKNERGNEMLSTRYDTTRWVMGNGMRRPVTTLRPSHLLDIWCDMHTKPGETVKNMVSDYETNINLPPEEVYEQIKALTSASPGDVIAMTVSSTLGQAIRMELMRHGIDPENVLYLMRNQDQIGGTK